MTKPSFPQVFNEYGIRFLSPEELAWNREQSCRDELRETMLDHFDDGHDVILFKPDDLHARIVTTLQRHGHLNTYELADEIVKAVVEGSRS